MTSAFNKIKSIFLNPTSGAYLSGKNRLWKAVKHRHPDITIRQINQFLAKSHIFSRQKRPVRKRLYRKHVATAKDQSWFCDLLFSKKAPYLACSDALIGDLYVKKIANKRPETTARAFKTFVSQNNNRAPSLVITDRGSEFSKRFSDRLKSEHNTRHKLSYSYNKASLIESQIAKLRGIHRKHALSTGNMNFNTNLPILLSSFHHSPNTRTGIAPSTFKTSDSGIIFTKKYSKYFDRRFSPSNTVSRDKVSKFHVGDFVRLQFKATTADVMNKAYKTSAEVFRIIRADFHFSPAVFKVADANNIIISRLLYDYNLVPAEAKYKQNDRVDKIISRKKLPNGEQLTTVRTEAGFERTATSEELKRLQKSKKF